MMRRPSAARLAILHALLAAAPIVPALLIAYLITQHRLPGGRPMIVGLAICIRNMRRNCAHAGAQEWSAHAALRHSHSRRAHGLGSC